MGTFTISARIRIVDETLIEIRVEDTIDGIMYQSVTHARLVNITAFGVGYDKMFVATMSVDVQLEVVVQLKNIVHEIRLEFEDVRSVTFPSPKFCPRSEEIFYRDDRIVGMSETTLKNPPAIFSRFWSESKRLICSGMSIILSYRGTIGIALVCGLIHSVLK